jgi:SPX domain protein involved in polyphosphate accumulation
VTQHITSHQEAKLRSKGQTEEQIEEWRMLVVSTLQAITSKQLMPTLRSQYMRTAFQIPFDATVRVRYVFVYFSA